MRVKFFLCINKEVNSKTEYPPDMSYEDRSSLQLSIQLEVLSSMVRHASTVVEGDVLPVVVCGEDFFQGAEISSEKEKASQTEQCCDRDIAYHFIANELIELSRQYRNVLIIPGSMYISTPALIEGGGGRYKQNGERRKGRLYAQNITPVLYNGAWIRLIKKGDFLQEIHQGSSKKTWKRDLISSQEHKNALEKGNTLIVPVYGEDTLDEINGLIFLGKTPLPGEEDLILSLETPNKDLFLPVFTVQSINFGVEICRDHGRRILEGMNLDFHIIVSDGIAWMYNACEYGYRVQADADSKGLTNITQFDKDDIVPLETVVLAKEKLMIQCQESPALYVIKHQQQDMMEEIVKLIEATYLSTSPKSGGQFWGEKPSFVNELKDIAKQYQEGAIALAEALQKIITMIEPLAKSTYMDAIKEKAERLLHLVKGQQHSAQLLEQHSNHLRDDNQTTSFAL